MSFSASKLHRRKSKSRSPQKKPVVPSVSAANDTIESGSGRPSDSSAKSYLVDPLVLSQTRRGQGTHGLIKYTPEALVVLPNRHVFTHLPAQQHRLDTRQSTNLSTSSFQGGSPNPHTTDSLPLPDDPFVDDGEPVPDGMHQVHVTSHNDESLELQQQRQRHRQKKERQWAKWEDKVIPSLLQPYLEILHCSESLRDIGWLENGDQCSCTQKTNLKIIGVYFQRMFDLHQAVLRY